ncbi:DUF397 domain-containing protein [Streptomyces millisiae]|uniref:DUF397 domain-containing protein n=1 Tax=Streptomyces millisiae TaxID=3075542 RepID=A0ABU2LVC9_9ACTN|nr:DUF397 domain-containing protein [Streptomyces sp. DSM 44918]MDT0321555.1 DUF397 domain-containing protein [Streptomyces sp. DSM 44918]
MINARSRDETSDLTWFKSSYSSSQGGDCVEVAAGPDRVHIRDSKSMFGPQLALTPASWATFIGQLHE